ncbi:HK97 gp10 family phage protein [Bailinhaonella thermotolerans]|nr:HK97 gp10 family phage protein [Bailinhaonella thermotolerans]
MPVTIEVHRAQVERVLSSPEGPVYRMVRRMANTVLNEAKRRVPVDHGTLRASLQVAMHTSPGRVWAVIGSSLHYAIYVHNGTGIYGPRKRRIVPISSKVLAWESRDPKTTPKNRGTMVFAPSVAGMEPRPFLVDALQDVAQRRGWNFRRGGGGS